MDRFKLIQNESEHSGDQMILCNDFLLARIKKLSDDYKEKRITESEKEKLAFTKEYKK